MTKKTLTIVQIILLTFLGSCKNNDRNFGEVKNLSSYKTTDFITTLETKISKDKNSIYCATFLFAWDEVRNKIKTPIQIKKNFTDLNIINNSKSFIGTLKNDEYFASVEIKGNSIIADAKFEKTLSFETSFVSYDKELNFKGVAVESFGSHGFDYDINKMIGILYYENDNNFILKLQPKDKAHEILLFKPEKEFNTISEMYSEVEKLISIGKAMNMGNNNWKYSLLEDDKVIIPKINFNIKGDFKNIVGNTFSSNQNEYLIEKAWQRTAFILDESGAKIESEAATQVATLSLEDVNIEKPKPKKMVFDKPFLLLLKRVDSDNPYFAVWMNDSELMTKNN